MHIIIKLQKISDKYKIVKPVKNVTLCRETEKKNHSRCLLEAVNQRK